MARSSFYALLLLLTLVLCATCAPEGRKYHHRRGKRLKGGRGGKNKTRRGVPREIAGATEFLSELAANGSADGDAQGVPHQPDFAPATETAATGSPGCKRLLWYTSMSEDRRADDYWEALSVAVMSAKAHAPSLQPVLVFLGQPNSRTAWFEKQGGIVIHHRLTFRHLLDEAVEKGWCNPNIVMFQGAFGRLDAPTLTEKVMPLINVDEFETEYILYTDVDVLFFRDITLCNFPQPPRQLMFGAEMTRGVIWNTGVVLMNVTALAADMPALLDFALERKWQFPTFDQDWLRWFYEGRIDYLPDVYNWKAYWGGGENVTIVHTHGPKPADKCTACFLQQRKLPSDKACECPGEYLYLMNLCLEADHGDLFQEVVDGFQRYSQQAGLPSTA